MTNRRNAWIALLAAGLGYVALFAWTYPPLSGIEDEAGFVNQALVWSRGALSSEGAGFAEVTDFGMPGVRPHLIDFVLAGDRHVAGRHPGRSLLLLPFVLLGGVRAGFVSGLLIHLLTTLVGAILLARLGRSPLWGVLILCHPTLALYSRTIMGDEAAGGGLLLAALLATVAGRRGAIGAGLAVGLAALARYHAGLALPFVAASIALDPARDHRRRDGLACLVAGGAAGGLIVVYNLALYGAPLDPVGAPRGQFGLSFFIQNAPFYAVALMALWPGMLLAPPLDRSPVGGLSRGLTGVFFVFFSLYYFHDRAGRTVETLVVGLRLMQVALPVWIVSYAGVIDDRLAAPIRERAGPRTARFLALAACLGLLATTALAFHKHQDHLRGLGAARDALTAEAAPGALVVEHGAVHKLFAIPSGGPVYRWRMLDFQGRTNDHGAELDRLREPWFLAVLVKGEGGPSNDAASLVERYKMRRVATGTPGLILYRADPPTETRP